MPWRNGIDTQIMAKGAIGLRVESEAHSHRFFFRYVGMWMSVRHDREVFTA
jgi:hypothetical protein